MCGTATTVAATLLVLFSSHAQGAETPDARFAAAQQVFEAARELAETAGADDVEVRKGYYRAAQAFASIAADGTGSVNLFVNAGNAFHFAGDPARSLLWYSRANRLANTPETRGGIATLRRVCGADLWPEVHGSIGRALMFWHHDLSPHTKQWIFFATFPVGCAALLVAVFATRPRRLLVRAGLALALVGALLGGSRIVVAAYPPPPRAVVVESGPGRAGNGDSYSVVVNAIRAGQEVEVIETRDDWTHIALPSGKTCWLPKSAVAKV